MDDALAASLERLGVKRARSFTLLALLLTALSGVPVSLALWIGSRQLLDVGIVFMHWGVPLLAAFGIEKQGLRSLGLVFCNERSGAYLRWAFIGFLLLNLIHAGEWLLLIRAAPQSAEALTGPTDLLSGLTRQLVFVGLPEELLFRGYLMTRLCGWLGGRRGLLFSATIFGGIHLFSRLVAFGSGYALPALIIGVSTSVAALVFGYLYLRTGSILPSAVAHIMLNLLGSRMVTLLS